ncbi:MAG: Tetratricopeptide repeat [Verrucomicrobiota bacterium]
MSYGSLEIAERDLQQVAQLAPSNYQGPLNAGVIALQRGDVIEARALFNRALTIVPQLGYSGAVRAMLGISWLADDLERAIRELDQAAIEAPNDVACAINLADALMREKSASSRSKAQSEYERGLRLVDKKIRRLEQYGVSSLTDRINRVRCLSGLGEMVPATVSIDQILSEHPKNQEAILVAGIVYELSGFRDKALAVLRRGLASGITEQRMRMEWAFDNFFIEFGGKLRVATKNNEKTN